MTRSDPRQRAKPHGGGPGEPRLHQLDGLRAVAFGAVFVHHAFGVPMLWAGVDLFFVLSGFLITGILLRQLSTDRFFTVFYFRRVLRILPPYYLMLILVFSFFEPVRREGWYWYVFFISNIRDAFFSGATGILGPMWSLAVEEQFYLLWPILIFFVGPRRLRPVCIGLVLAAPALRGVLTVHCESFRPAYHLLPARCDLLAAGALMAMLWHRSPARFVRISRLGPWIAGASLAVFAVLAVSMSDFRTSANSLLFNTAGYSLIGLLMVAVVGYCIPRRNTWPIRWLSSRPLVYLGMISYMMYLSHEVFLMALGGLGQPTLMNAVGALALTIGWSAASWRLLERPLQEYKNKVSSYRPPDGRPA